MTSYVKMIDIWMIFTMLYPFSEIALVCAKDYFKKRAMLKQGLLSHQAYINQQLGYIYVLVIIFAFKLQTHVFEDVASKAGIKHGSCAILEAKPKIFRDITFFRH